MFRDKDHEKVGSVSLKLKISHQLRTSVISHKSLAITSVAKCSRFQGGSKTQTQIKICHTYNKINNQPAEAWFQVGVQAGAAAEGPEDQPAGLDRPNAGLKCKEFIYTV